MNKRILYAFSGVMVLLMSGMVYAWSVFSSAIGAEFPSWSKASLSLTFTLVMVFFCLGGLVGGFLAEKIRPRYYVWAAALLFLTGFTVASRASSPIALYIGFGLLCGLGSGLSYNGVMSSVSKWFPESQGLISGILLMGFGLSSFIVGKVFQSLSSVHSWRWTFQIFGIVSAAVFILFAFFIKRPEGMVAKSGVKKDGGKEYTPSEMVRMPAFYLFFVWAFLMSAAGLALVSQASGIVGAAVEVSPSAVATLAGLISIANGLGRVGFGIVYDRKGGNVVMLAIDGFFVLSALLLFAAINAHSLILLVAGFVVGGFGYGGITCANSAYISATFGQKNYPRNFSIINMNLLVASFGSTIAGSLLDGTGTYLSISYMMLVLAAAGILLTLGIIKVKGKS